MILTRAPTIFGNQAKTQEFYRNSSPNFAKKLNISASPVSYDAQKVAKKNPWVKLFVNDGRVAS